MLYIPCKDENEAKMIGSSLVKHKLAACTNIFPISSIFMWKGELAGEEEAALLVKTAQDKYDEAEAEVKRLHSYDVPAIISIRINANKEYERWLRSELTRK